MPEEKDCSSNDNYDDDDVNGNGNSNGNGDDGDDHDHDNGEDEERRRLGRLTTSLSDYELLWIRNIKRNNVRLASLCLSGNGESYWTILEVTAAEERRRGRRGRSEGRKR